MSSISAARPSTRGVRFAISIPQRVPDGTFDPIAFREYMSRAEALGFESAWTGEQIIGTLPHLGPIETMTYAAACTRAIRLGCAVLITPLYSPLHLAKSISSLDQLSRGRVDVGVGSGGPWRMFGAFGVERDQYLARFKEGLDVMRRCWTEERVTFAGRFWQLEDVAMEPKPFQKPQPPLWFGGGHPNALRRAVMHANAFIGAGSSTTAQFTDHVRILREQLADAGRDPSTLTIAKRVYIAVDDDASRATTVISDALDEMYGYFGRTGLASVAVSGTVDDCIAGLRDVVAAGAQLILLNPLVDDLEQMERLADQVVPHVGVG
jgi:alkanesulfonate monooxygenase SsuD/methylene tetrahydromethanopterin reductase-like flavin-dependent oxidoreductase (luciferase family)